MISSHPFPLLVHLTRTIDDDDLTLSEGSGVWVERTTPKHYIGYWSSSIGTYQVTIPKAACRVVKDRGNPPWTKRRMVSILTASPNHHPLYE
jgi:hypothetical protein